MFYSKLEVLDCRLSCRGLSYHRLGNSTVWGRVVMQAGCVSLGNGLFVLLILL